MGVLDDYPLHPAYLIVGSLALAALGARVFLWIVGFAGRNRAAQIMVMLAIVWIVFASAVALKLSALLTLLACGAFVRTFDQQRLLARTDIGWRQVWRSRCFLHCRPRSSMRECCSPRGYRLSHCRRTHSLQGRRGRAAGTVYWHFVAQGMLTASDCCQCQRLR